MGSTPAAVAPGPGGSLSRNANFQSLGSLSAGRLSPSLGRAGRGSGPLNSPAPSIMSSPKLWHKASVSRLAEEFFWIGGSVVAQPKWRLGQLGKSLSRK